MAYGVRTEWIEEEEVFGHLKKDFASGELSEDSVVSKMETTAADGKRYQY